MGILYDPKNVVVGLAVGYFAEVGSALPLNTIPFSGDWGAPWKQAGGTEEGFRLTADMSSTPHTIEEQPNPVLTTLDNRTLSVAASLAEDTLDSMRLAFGGGTITTVVGTGGAPTVKDFALSPNVDEFAFGLDMETYPVTISPGVVKRVTRRIIIPRMSGSGSVDVAFRRAASKRLWPLALTQLCKPSEVIIRDIVPTA